MSDLTARDLELIEVALTSAVHACIGMDDLVNEYGRVIEKIDAMRFPPEPVEFEPPVELTPVCMLCGERCGKRLVDHEGVWE